MSDYEDEKDWSDEGSHSENSHENEGDWSDESSSSKEASDDGEFEEGAEDYEDYKVDGYHPVYLGEVFNGKYQVIQKLGWGHFSTVWLVNEKGTSNHFALKIQKSKKSYGESALEELEVLQCLEQNSKNPEWFETVLDMNSKFEISLQPTDTFNISLVDNFLHYGMHGTHYCSVFHLLGPNLLDAIHYFERKDEGMDIQLVKIITRQILMGLDYLHRVCKVIHTDLKPENIMLELEGKQLDEFIAGLKEYKKKPLSMKYLESLPKKTPMSSKKKQVVKNSKPKVLLFPSLQGGDTGMLIESIGSVKFSQSQLSNCLDSQVGGSMIEESSKNTTFYDESETQARTEDYYTMENGYLKKEKQMEESTFGFGDISMKSSERKTAASESNGSKIQEEEKKCDDWESWSYELLWKKHIKVKLDKNVKVKIVDFGNACWTYKHFTDNIQTREYRSPEAILGIPYNETTDIWSLACIIFEMLTSTFLFKPKKGKNHSKSEEHLALMMEHLGPMPKDWALSGKYSRDYFRSNGELRNVTEMEETTIGQALMENDFIDFEEAMEIEAFLKPMLEYDPDKRITAYEALQSEWLWT